MMQPAFTLSLSFYQAAQLVEICTAYREFAWHELEPSPGRNQIMKAVQAIQGRISDLRRRTTVEPLLLTLNEDEKRALRSMLLTLMEASKAEAPSDERTYLLGCLASLRAFIERASSPGANLYTMKEDV